jgi:hypothetical protein
MENHYLCPHCRGHLRVGDNIIFKIRNTRREKGLLLLHPEAGDFTSMKHPHFTFQEGERIDFFCPICLQNLDAAFNENLIHVVMIDAQRTEHEIYFSRITGEKSTYKVSNKGVMETGEFSHRYTRCKMSDQSIQYLQS